MRLRDAFSLPSSRFGFLFQTQRTLLTDFSPREPIGEEAAFVSQALAQALQFLSKARPDGELITTAAEFLLQLRLIVRENDYGISSYGLGRALAGDLEACSARMYENSLVQLEKLISNNASAADPDEYLQPEDVLHDVIRGWRVRGGATMLAMLDLSERAGLFTAQAESMLFDGLDLDGVESIFDALVITST